MLSRALFLRLCSIRNMFYTLFLISLCAALHVWILDAILDFTDNMRSTFFNNNFLRLQLKPNANTKYILSWNHRYLTSNVSDSFPNLNCAVKNCIFTRNKDFLNRISAFDAIIFDEDFLSSNERPEQRSPHQIFTFMSNESSYKYPACELYNDNYFNWTFTHRFDSDMLWRFFVVRNNSGQIVAPSSHAVWTESTGPLRSQIKSKFNKKSRAVVWIVQKCSTESYKYMLRLEKHLHHFALNLQKYSKLKTSNIFSNVSVQKYLFVLAFEETILEDYVSARVMDGYRNFAVPIVYGGANYSRFLPPGSYIDAAVMHPYNVANAIREAVANKTVFENYFKWTNLYAIEEWGAEQPLCELCAALHEKPVKQAPAVSNFRVWWNSPDSMHRCLPAEHLSIDKNNHNKKKIHLHDRF